MKKLFCSFAALCAVSFAYAAEAVYFRSGAVLCAETSTLKPAGYKRLALGKVPEDPVYAAVTVKLDEGRKVSIFDYSLKVGSTEYPCAAVRDNSADRFALTVSGGKKRRCTLFFELDSSEAESGSRHTLVCNAPDGGEVTLKFTARGSSRFTPDSRIPEPSFAKPAVRGKKKPSPGKKAKNSKSGKK